MSGTWFLHRRITLAFALTASILSVVLAVPFAWATRSAIQEEIDALAREELEETKAHFAEGSPPSERFAAIAAEMQEEHEENPLAWRIWVESTGVLWTEIGPPALLARAPQAPPEQAFERLDSAIRRAAASLGSDRVAVVLLDGSYQSQRFTSFALSALGFALLATAVATLAGRLLGGRVSKLLGQVAECARTEEAAERWPSPNQAPEEVRAVVRALQDTLKRIRSESENARLLTSGMAHELRSPLQNLMGETQVALLRDRDPEEYRHVLESQLEDLAELSRMVDNLVTLSALDEARRRRTVERFDLAEESRLRLTREFQLAKRRDVRLEFLAEGPLVVEGDRESLLLALRNLVTNAIEWSPAGGKVELCMRLLPSGLEILVDDAGPGVPFVDRQQIFRPFHRGAAARGRRVGFGLGLALTHSAVSAQGGTIEVLDSPLGGARFRILLPPSMAPRDDEATV
ncbi:MAG: hypothetical protein EXS08_15720 [Planctomycetes bacterium]|nr:hypothetical protein [Planctomycetota bacterium]